MNRQDRTPLLIVASLVLLLGLGLLFPNWQFLGTLAIGKGLTVLGLLLLLRTGLVSFGQGLYYCLGAYAAGTLSQFTGVTDVLVLLLTAAAASGVAAVILGILLAAYRGIFFSMLSLALSMILYGLLVKTAALGSTDGFNLAVPTLLGLPLASYESRYPLFSLACVVAALAALAMHYYFRTPLGRLSPAIRDNEIRVEYLGASVRAAVHVKYTIAGVLAGIGGALTGLTVGHIDPEMAYWTTSGEFVFVAILSGTGSVAAPFLGSFIFELVRTFAYEYSPNSWQLALGTVMLLIIVFLPAGLWSLMQRRRA